jgi:hypothetical protein
VGRRYPGGQLSGAGPQHDRRDRLQPPRRRSAARLASGRAAHRHLHMSASPSSRPARATTGAATAPGSGCPSSKGLLDLHGGGLEIESRLGAGTRITFHLPIDCRTRRGTAGAVEPLVRRCTAAGEDRMTGREPVRKSA